MDEKKGKQGLSVREIEGFAKKYSFEVIFVIVFIFACFFSFVFFGPGWGVTAASIGGIIGVFLPKKIEGLAKKSFAFLYKQEKITQLILAIVLIILSIFLPPLIFLVIGLHSGIMLHHIALGPRGS